MIEYMLKKTSNVFLTIPHTKTACSIVEMNHRLSKSASLCKLRTSQYAVSSTDRNTMSTLRCSQTYVHDVVVCDGLAIVRQESHTNVRNTFDIHVYTEPCLCSVERRLQTLILKQTLFSLNQLIQKHCPRLAINYVYAFFLVVCYGAGTFTYCDDNFPFVRLFVYINFSIICQFIKSSKAL